MDTSPNTDCNVQRAAGGPSDPDTHSAPDEGWSLGLQTQHLEKSGPRLHILAFLC